MLYKHAAVFIWFWFYNQSLILTGYKFSTHPVQIDNLYSHILFFGRKFLNGYLFNRPNAISLRPVT